jgi:hypothetical protein
MYALGRRMPIMKNGEKLQVLYGGEIDRSNVLGVWVGAKQQYAYLTAQ